MKLREKGKIAKTFLGKEDHGILTCTIGIDLKGGCYQSFGNLCLQDKKLADDFVTDLCATFSVKRLADLQGKSCVALYCFDGLNEPIEALEAPNGKRFVITDWRRKHFPDTLDRLADRKVSIEREIAFLKRRIREEQAKLKCVDAEYRPIGSP
jgi:hypothetical protein